MCAGPRGWGGVVSLRLQGLVRRPRAEVVPVRAAAWRGARVSFLGRPPHLLPALVRRVPEEGSPSAPGPRPGAEGVAEGLGGEKYNYHVCSLPTLGLLAAGPQVCFL